MLGRVHQSASKVLMLWRFPSGVLTLEFVAKLLQAEFNIVAVTVAGVCLPICVRSFWGTYAVVPVLETAPGTVVAGGHAMLAGRERHECVRLKTHENRRS